MFNPDLNKRVICTISFFYDPESYIFDWDGGDMPDDEEIFRRCREMMFEDLNGAAFDREFDSIIETKYAT